MKRKRMNRDQLSRRQFHRLSAAALGGLVAGAAIGCGEEKTAPVTKTKDGGGDAPLAKTSAQNAPAEKNADGKTAPGKTAPDKTAVVATAVAMHACRGLNECKGQGKDGKNVCAGQGTCFTTKHECSGQNDCKYQGGCGGTMGTNDCKGKGGCGHLPIPNSAWGKARESFEARMKQAGKMVGQAPKPADA